MLYMSISGFFANAACGPKAHSDTAPTVDKNMPLRFLRYIAEFYENLDRGSQQKHRLPPVLPILLYTGNARWTAPPNFQTMVEQSIPSKYIPHFEYFPILVNEIPAETLYNMKNAVSAVFYFENSRVEDLIATIDALFEIVKNGCVRIQGVGQNDGFGLQARRRKVLKAECTYCT